MKNKKTAKAAFQQNKPQLHTDFPQKRSCTSSHLTLREPESIALSSNTKDNNQRRDGSVITIRVRFSLVDFPHLWDCLTRFATAANETCHSSTQCLESRLNPTRIRMRISIDVGCGKAVPALKVQISFFVSKHYFRHIN